MRRVHTSKTLILLWDLSNTIKYSLLRWQKKVDTCYFTDCQTAEDITYILFDCYLYLDFKQSHNGTFGMSQYLPYRWSIAVIIHRASGGVSLLLAKLFPE